jgi:hypothetical protein
LGCVKNSPSIVEELYVGMVTVNYCTLKGMKGAPTFIMRFALVQTDVSMPYISLSLKAGEEAELFCCEGVQKGYTPTG